VFSLFEIFTSDSVFPVLFLFLAGGGGGAGIGGGGGGSTKLVFTAFSILMVSLVLSL
jgi:hypothetical protein